MFKPWKTVSGIVAGALFVLNIAASEEGELKPPVLWYHFDEGWGDAAIDSSGKENNGQLVGGVKWSKGKFGAGLEFDGKSGYVICPDSPSLHLDKTVSMTVWFKPQAASSIMNIIMGASCKNRINMGGHCIQGSFSVDNIYCKTDAMGVMRNEWNYAAVTYNGEKTALYLNGNLIGESKDKTGKLLFSGPIIISSEGCRAYFFEGIIDEVKIYDYALSPEELRKEYKSLPPAPTPKEQLSALKKNVGKKIESLNAKLSHRDKNECSDFLDILENLKQLQNDIARHSAEKELASSYISLKNTWDELNNKIKLAENALNKKMEKEQEKLQSSINMAQQDINSLKKDALAYRPAQNDADMAGVYLNLGKLETIDGFKKTDYLKKGFACLETSSGKINKARENSIKDPVGGSPGELMIGVTYIPNEISPAFLTLKALKINFSGNSIMSSLGWNSFFNPDTAGKLDDRLKLFDDNGFNIMLVLNRPDYQLSGLMETQGKFQDETVSGQWSLYKGQWQIPAAPADIPLKWVKEQEKYLKKFIEKYKNYKCISHWDIWGESHPLSPFYQSSPLVVAAFKKYLAKKYADINKLNKTWKTNYKSFEEITIDSNNIWNTAEWNTYRHILPAHYIAYLTNIVKETDPTRPISPVPDMDQMYTDMSALDPYILAKAGGIYKEAGIDIYAARRDKFPWQAIASYLDTGRSITNGEKVWIGEIGHWVNHAAPAHSNCTYPEEVKEWGYTAFLHGAKAVSYFSWDQGDLNAGTDQEGDSFALMHSDFTPFASAIKIAETACEARNYKELWSCKPDRNVAIYYPRLSALLKESSRKEMYGLYAVMTDCGFGMDPVDSEFLKEKISKYKILVIPPAPYIEEDVQREILKFIKNGGIVFASSRIVFNEWGEANSVPEFSRLLSANNPAAKYAPCIKSVNKLDKGVLCVIGGGIGADYRQDKNIPSGITTKIPIDFDRVENGKLREIFLAFLAAECGVEPYAVSSKEGIETAVISNDTCKYMMLISHRDKSVETVITLKRISLNPGKTTLYDIFSFKEAEVKRKNNSYELKTIVEPHEVLIFPLDNYSGL